MQGKKPKKCKFLRIGIVKHKKTMENQSKS